MNYPAAEQQGIRCHAGLEEPAPHRDAGASSFVFWIPAFAGMTTRRKRRRIKPLSASEGFIRPPEGKPWSPPAPPKAGKPQADLSASGGLKVSIGHVIIRVIL